jgi:enoyl-CoA hydratase/carnithine racemase
MKALVDDGLQVPAAVALRQERELNRIHALSHDRREGLAAFAEKRKPHFVGA